MTRQVPAGTAWRVARLTLGRMACIYEDPAADGHQHADCVRDDESYIADLLLGFCAAAVTGNEDMVLDRLTDLTDALDHG